MKDDRPETNLDKGIHFAQVGNLTQAGIFLSQAIQTNPNSAKAWFWLSKVVEDPEKKKYCYSRAISLDPGISTSRMDTKDELGVSPAKQVSESAEIKHTKIDPPAKETNSSQTFSQSSAKDSTSAKTPSPSNGQFISAETIPVSKGTNTNELSKQQQKPSHFTLLRILFGFLLSLAVCGIPITYLIISGYLDGFIPLFVPLKTANSQVLQTTASSLIIQTFTATPSNTTAPTPTATISLNPVATVQSIDLEMFSASNRMAAEDYPNAILILERIIVTNPEYAEAYYQRGLAYRSLTHSIRSQSEFLNYLKNAISDFDHAIDTGPVKGDYFINRAYALWDVALELELRADRAPLLSAALENIHIGIVKGTSLIDAPLEAVKLHNLNGQCEIGLSELKELEKAEPSKTSHYFEIEKIMANTYLCLGQYTKALEKINEAIKCGCDYWQYNILKAEILYYLGNVSQALDILNKDIESAPSGAGTRYYQRALIYYDQGKYDLARDDLDTGARNTWWRGDIFPYLLSKFAAIDGDNESARSLLQFAEASLLQDQSPIFIKRIKNDMAKLGIPYLSPTPQVILKITPIPSSIPDPHSPTAIPAKSNTAQPNFPTPGGNVLPDGYLDAITVDFTSGIGNRTLAPGSHTLFHFVLQESIAVIRATKITFHLLPKNGLRPPLQLYMWTRGGGWRMINPIFGDNEVEYPSFYIGEKGDFYVSIRNYSSSGPVTIENAGFTITVLRVDGSDFTYGLKP